MKIIRFKVKSDPVYDEYGMQIGWDTIKDEKIQIEDNDVDAFITHHLSDAEVFDVQVSDN